MLNHQHSWPGLLSAIRSGLFFQDVDARHDSARTRFALSAGYDESLPLINPTTS